METIMISTILVNICIGCFACVGLALEDECVIKWAFNATFERICLSRFLGYPTGEYLKPESWRCSMIWSATMGLPLSLEGVTNQKAL